MIPLNAVETFPSSQRRGGGRQLYRSCRATPSAPLWWLRGIFLVAHPLLRLRPNGLALRALLCEEGNGLEHQLQRELDLPRGPIRLSNHACRWADPSSRKNDLVRGSEIGVIENIDGLRPELQSQFLADGELLEQRCVEVYQARAPQRSSRHVAKGSGSRHLEGPRIEPLIRFPQNHRSFKIRIPVGHVGLAGVARPRKIGANQRREGEPALSREDPIPLPAADQLIHETGGAARESLPISERQLIEVTRIELMEEAKGRNAFAPVANIRADNRRRLIFAGRGQES